MIFESITQLIGGTPLVRLQSFGAHNVLVKMETMNPLQSVKDRLALGLIRAAERENKIGPETVVLEPTSGNTGIGLAFICAAKGIQLTLTMPENMSLERRKLLCGMGAQVVLTPAELGMQGAIDKAESMAAADPNYLILRQFESPANAEIHRITTAEEIWADTEGEIDIFVAGVGTGGTITGVARGLKDKKPGLKVVAVEPSDSPVLSEGKSGCHDIQGIGAGFVPKILDRSLLDEVIPVSYAEAEETARRLAQEEGILAGPSSGANVFAAVRLANRLENLSKLVVTLICDSGERYLSTPLYDIDETQLSYFVS